MGNGDGEQLTKGSPGWWNKPITTRKMDRIILFILTLALAAVSIVVGTHNFGTGLGLGATGLGILVPLAAHGNVFKFKEETYFWTGIILGILGLIITFFSVLTSVS